LNDKGFYRLTLLYAPTNLFSTR